MPLDLYLGFVLATAVLAMIPGPNMSLIVATSIAYGTRYGLLTLAGSAVALVLQLCVTVLGLSAVLGVLADWFAWIRWIGVGYLLYLGLLQWFAPAAGPARVPPQPRSARRVALRGFLVSLTNPKTLLFYSAFFPQFIAPDAPARPQLVLLACSFLCVLLALDSCWAVLAGRMRGFATMHGRMRNRVSGGCLMGAAVGLALAHRS